MRGAQPRVIAGLSRTFDQGCSSGSLTRSKGGLPAGLGSAMKLSTVPLSVPGAFPAPIPDASCLADRATRPPGLAKAIRPSDLLFRSMRRWYVYCI
jgi:hypothetical protein